MVQAFKRRLPASFQREQPRDRKLDTGAGLYGRRWRELTEAWLRQYPFCTLCLVMGELNGCLTQSEDTRRQLIVDHIQPHQNESTLYWNQSNWQTLGKRHHDHDKQSAERRGQDWFELLRKVMQEQNTRAFVEQHAEWMPAHIFDALMNIQ